MTGVPSPPAMMHDRRERAQNGVSLLGEAHVRKESFSALPTVTTDFSCSFGTGFFWAVLVFGQTFSGRPEHVPWREVSSHLIALIVGIYQKYALSHPHPNLCQAGP